MHLMQQFILNELWSVSYTVLSGFEPKLSQQECFPTQYNGQQSRGIKMQSVSNQQNYKINGSNFP